MSKTSDRLRQLRESKGLSQGDVAKAIGVSRPAYVSYETGKSRPTRTVQQLAAFFHVTTDYLLGRSDNPAPVRRPVQINMPNKLSEKYLMHLFTILTNNGKFDPTLADINGYPLEEAIARYAAENHEPKVATPQATPQANPQDRYITGLLGSVKDRSKLADFIRTYEAMTPREREHVQKYCALDSDHKTGVDAITDTYYSLDAPKAQKKKA